jgi:hypothetical protein
LIVQRNGSAPWLHPFERFIIIEKQACLEE